MNINKFAVKVTSGEGKLKQVNIAQIKEVLKVVNKLTGGVLYAVIKILPFLILWMTGFSQDTIMLSRHPYDCIILRCDNQAYYKKNLQPTGKWPPSYWKDVSIRNIDEDEDTIFYYAVAADARLIELKSPDTVSVGALNGGYYLLPFNFYTTLKGYHQASVYIHLKNQSASNIAKFQTITIDEINEYCEDNGWYIQQLSLNTNNQILFCILRPLSSVLSRDLATATSKKIHSEVNNIVGDTYYYNRSMHLPANFTDPNIQKLIIDTLIAAYQEQYSYLTTGRKNTTVKYVWYVSSYNCATLLSIRDLVKGKDQKEIDAIAEAANQLSHTATVAWRPTGWTTFTGTTYNCTFCGGKRYCGDKLTWNFK